MTFLIYGEKLSTVIITTQGETISFKGGGMIAEKVNEVIKNYKQDEADKILIDELQAMCEKYDWEMVAY